LNVTPDQFVDRTFRFCADTFPRADCYQTLISFRARAVQKLTYDCFYRNTTRTVCDLLRRLWRKIY